MSLSRLSRFLQAGFRLNKVGKLHQSQSARVLKLDVNSNDSANLLAGCRRLYSTEPELTEPKVLTEIHSGATNTNVTEQINATDELEDLTLLSGLKKLDDQVKRLGRVGQKQVRSLLKKCKKGMSSVEAVMLIRCCGNLMVRETPQQRKGILEEVWKKVENFCPDITTDIINAMMAVKIENSIDFKPSVELARLQKKNCVPNKMTFDLMMSQYCEIGDVLGATEVLNHMKLLDLPINLSSMHHLIKGYGKNGDFEEANKLISTMSQHKLRPTADTYTALMVGYAEKGNLDGIKEVMTTVAAKNIDISLGNANEVILKLAVSGHSEKVEEALDILVGGSLHKYGDQFRGRLGSHKKFDFQDTLNLLYQLLANGKYDAIKFVLRKALANGVIFKDILHNICNGCIISELIKNGKPPKEVLMVRDMLVEEDMMNPELESLALCAMQTQKLDYILEMFAELKDLGMFFKPHYFWPLFSKASKDNKAEDIYKITKVLTDVTNDSKSMQSMQTLIEWSFEALLDLGQKPDTILSKYEELKLSEWKRDVMEMDHLIKEGKFAEIGKMIENGHQFSANFILPSLSQGIKKSNVTELMELIKLMQGKLKTNMKTNSYFLLHTIKSFKDQSEDLNKFIQSWVDNELKFENNPQVITEAKRRNVNNELLEKVSALSVPNTNLREFNSPLLKDLNLKDLPDIVKPSVKNIQSTDLESKVKNLLKKREYREVQNILYRLSEKGDLDSLTSLEKLSLPQKMSNFFDKCMVVGHIQSGKAKEFAETKTDENLEKFISLKILHMLAEKEPEVFARVEKMLEKPMEEITNFSPYASLYLYYFTSNNEQKINNFLQMHPTIKDRIRLERVCRQAKFDKDEVMLNLVIKIHKDSKNPRQIASAYNNLILIKCEAKDCHGALDLYNEALSNGLTFDDFFVRTLQSMQALLQGNQLPLPWKDGEVEKKAAKNKNDLPSSDSDSE